MSCPSVSSLVARIFSTVQPWARSFCIAADVTWSLVWLDNIRETKTWKRLTWGGQPDIYLWAQTQILKIYSALTLTDLHVQERLHRGIYLLPCYLRGHHGCFSWLECFLVVSSSTEVPSGPSLAVARSHLCHIPLSAVSSCDCVRTGLERLFLVSVHYLNQHQKQSTTHGYSADLQDKKCLSSWWHIRSTVIYSDYWWLIEAQYQTDNQTSSTEATASTCWKTNWKHKL